MSSTNNIIFNNETTNVDISINLKKKKKKKSKNRCVFSNCRVKLKLSDMKCKCGSTFCSKHRMMESHCCTYLKNTSSKDIYLSKASGLGGGNFKQLEVI